jgi:hypothetical protein
MALRDKKRQRGKIGGRIDDLCRSVRR